MTATEDRSPVVDDQPPGVRRGGSVRRPKQPGQQEWGRLAFVVAAVVAMGVIASWSIVFIILALIFMIFMHELGHYVTAKAAGMKVTEFFIGFGPRIWSFRRGETEYGLKGIPAGAYVKIVGMSNLETDVDPVEEHMTYRHQPYWRRMSVALAGSTMHFLMAILLWFTIVSVIGERTTTLTVEEAAPGGAAAAAGLQAGDRIVALDGLAPEDFGELRDRVRQLPGEDVDLVVERAGVERTLQVTVGTVEGGPGEPDEVGSLGVLAASRNQRIGPIEGAGRAVTETGSVMWQSIKGLGSVFSPDGINGYVDTLAESPSERRTIEDDGNGFLSPVGAVRIANQAADNGFVNLLAFLFAINVFVGVFNLVPLLPLDGGHVAIATYERIRSRRGRPYHADVAKLLPLTYGVVLLLIVVGITALYLDIARPLDLG